jgi:hypothetical protein
MEPLTPVLGGPSLSCELPLQVNDPPKHKAATRMSRSALHR